MADHTPGPWNYTFGDVMRVTTKDAKAVCGIHRIGLHTGNPEPEVWAANARLIAAAPDLLAALQETWRVIDAAGLHNLSRGVQLGQTSWFVKASDAKGLSEAAIAKASGAPA